MGVTKRPRISRRKFVLFALASLPIWVVAYAFYLETEWLAVRKVHIGGEPPKHRIVHFSDLHYEGARSYLKKAVAKINELSPDFVCFTGDIVEQSIYLDGALEALGQIRFPLFGVPGNHDQWMGTLFEKITECFEATGGAWLVDREITASGGDISIVGTNRADVAVSQPSRGRKRILITHFPAIADELRNDSLVLILAGHSHGGQVRIPFYGALVLPYRVGKYDRGLFHTPAGPLYVNPGIGTYSVPVRFCCRPEITLIEF